VAVLVGLWAVRSHARAWDWRDEQTLFARELRINPLSLPANQVLGHAAAARGVEADRHGDRAAALHEYATAALHYERALRVKPDDVRNWFNLGNAFLRQGHWPEAVAAYDQALRLDAGRADVHYNRGVALYQSGRADAARAAFEASLASDPDYALARSAIDTLNAAAQATTEPAQP
jgi:tetratricopeptide (TPR) repeat protein